MTTNRGAGRLEHILVDRLFPILMVVVLPLLGTLWFVDNRQHETRRDQLREACQRMNDVRRDQKFIFGYMIETGRVLSIGASDPSVRVYYAKAAEAVREKSERLAIIDCDDVIR